MILKHLNFKQRNELKTDKLNKGIVDFIEIESG